MSSAGEMEVSREFLYVDNLAEACIFAIENRSKLKTIILKTKMAILYFGLM